jgi:hypothetical protein
MRRLAGNGTAARITIGPTFFGLVRHPSLAESGDGVTVMTLSGHD